MKLKKILNWWMAIVVAVVAVTVVVLLAVKRDNQDPNEPFFLVDEGTAIRKQGEKSEFIRASDLPDTVPTAFPHAAKQRFDNRRFHIMTVSPDGRLIAFACGEGDQWLGVINYYNRYVRFIVFGVETTFLDACWSPDSKYLAYALYGPDKRMLVFITDPSGPSDSLSKNMNAWYKLYWQGEGFRSIGWVEPGDTIYTFKIYDAKDNELETVNLPLHFVPKSAPAGAIPIDSGK